MANRQGKLIILSGPSGVGKGTICKELLKNSSLNLVYSVSMTTRKQRNNEIEGKSYFFVSLEEFQKAIINNELLEYAQFVGNFYGTPAKYVQQQISLGKNVILEIEVDGANQVLTKTNDCLSLFLVPPSLSELKRRLIERKSESLSVIKQRLIKAKREIKLQNQYQYIIINDEINRVVNEITNILLRELK